MNDETKPLFKPAKVSAETKAAMTTEAAREIMAAEETARLQKTERLRKLREAAGSPTEEKKTSRKRTR